MKGLFDKINDQVDYIKNRDITYRMLHTHANIINASNGITIQVPFQSLLRKYRDFMSSIIVTADLTDELEAKYRFKPKMLSQDLYGTTELWDELLFINGCASTMEFEPKETIRIYDLNRVKSLINEILVLEQVI